MELVLKNVNYTYKSRKILSNINLTLLSSNIIGLTGENKTVLLEIIDDIKKYDGEIIIDGEKFKSNRLNYRKLVALIKQDNIFFTTKVIDEMKFIINNLRYENENIDKKMKDSLKLVGLDKSYLERDIITLSETEKTLVNIACNLLTNPKIIMFDEVFTNLDANKRKIIINLIKRLKNKDKIVIISSNNTDLLYKITDKIIILKNSKIIGFDDTNLILRDYSFLVSNNIDIPYLVDFTYKARNNKHIRLGYHKDILDLIKDVYKHV